MLSLEVIVDFDAYSSSYGCPCLRRGEVAQGQGCGNPFGLSVKLYFLLFHANPNYYNSMLLARPSSFQSRDCKAVSTKNFERYEEWRIAQVDRNIMTITLLLSQSL